MTFAEQFRAARQNAGLSQAALSEATRIPSRTIQDWEAGKRTPPEYVQVAALDHLRKVASAKGKRYELRMFRSGFSDAKENPFWYEVSTWDKDSDILPKVMSFATVSETAAYVEELESQGYSEAK